MYFYYGTISRVNFVDPIPDQEGYIILVEMIVSNRWSKILHSLVGINDVKYIIYLLLLFFRSPTS